MVKFIGRIKNFFSSKFIYRPKKKEPQPKAEQSQTDKTEEKAEEQKQQSST